MTRLMLLLGGCLLLAGCSASPTDVSKNDDQKSASKGDGKSLPPKGSTPAGQAAFDYLAGSYRGDVVEILSSKEHPVTTAKTVATALQVEWRLKSSKEQHNDILLIQADKVIFSMPSDPAKSLEGNAAAAIKQFEN